MSPEDVIGIITPSTIFLGNNGDLYINPDEDEDEEPQYTNIIGIKSITIMLGTAANVSIKDFTIITGSTDNKEEKGMSSGTGFFIDRRGYLATNNHVIEDADDISVVFNRNGERQIHSARVIKTDATNDVAILRITDDNFRPFANIPYNFKTGKSELAEEVFTLGYPEITTLGFDEPKYNKGEINSLTGVQGDATMYQISIPIHHGNSGGPLFDEKGNLIGITSAGLDPSRFDNVNYAVKSSYLKTVIDALPIDLDLPNDNTTGTLTRPQQIKKLKEFVVLILAK